MVFVPCLTSRLQIGFQKNGSTTPDSSVLASLLGEIREKRLPQGEETEQLDIARNVAATGYGGTLQLSATAPRFTNVLAFTAAVDTVSTI